MLALQVFNQRTGTGWGMQNCVGFVSAHRFNPMKEKAIIRPTWGWHVLLRLDWMNTSWYRSLHSVKIMHRNVFWVGKRIKLQTPQLHFAIQFVPTWLSRMLPALYNYIYILYKSKTLAGHEITTKYVSAQTWIQCLKLHTSVDFSSKQCFGSTSTRIKSPIHPELKSLLENTFAWCIQTCSSAVSFLCKVQISE